MQRIQPMLQAAYTFFAKGIFLPGSLCLLLLGALVSGCDFNSPTTTTQGAQTFTSNASHQAITYSSNPHDVILRTFYGGALAGTLELAPRISLYGDGSYILGLDRRGKLSSDNLQTLLSTLVDTDGLLSLSKQQFFDLPDQNATYLELKLNNKMHELVYGIFGSQPESQDAMDEYHRLGHALQTITESLKGPTRPYTTGDYALFARQISFVDHTQIIPYWSLPDFTLYQLATFECGVVPEDTTSSNKEIACLKFTVPHNALQLTADQYNALKAQLPPAQPEVFSENGLYYEVTMRPLLPDEKQQKMLAMFGSTQMTYKAIPLQIGPIPQSTPTP